MKFVILSSSRGTTAQAVFDALKKGSLTMECLGLITDKKDRGCVAKAEAAGVPVKIIERSGKVDREEYDKRLHEAILQMGGTPEDTIIAALGWMYILSSGFVHTWKNRIVNVHPSLLPKYPGGHAIADTLKSGDTESGMTIHFIDEGTDTGPIILQKTCDVAADDTEESLKEKIQALEKEWYPQVLQMIETGNVSLK